MTTVGSWTEDAAGDERMQHGHTPIWQAMIDAIVEPDLTTLGVLDFGCNQGRFLHQLYARRPFRRGVGLDLAAEAIAVAQARRRNLPLEYAVAPLTAYPAAFDLAFSHEVLYLLPDLAAHAAEMAAALRPGGAYYATIGCHLENSLWPRWRRAIAARASVPPQDYALDDVVDAFVAAGFRATARRLRLDCFLDYTPEDRDSFGSLARLLDYYSRDKVLFRFVRG